MDISKNTIQTYDTHLIQQERLLKIIKSIAVFTLIIDLIFIAQTHGNTVLDGGVIASIWPLAILTVIWLLADAKIRHINSARLHLEKTTRLEKLLNQHTQASSRQAPSEREVKAPSYAPATRKVDALQTSLR